MLLHSNAAGTLYIKEADFGSYLHLHWNQGERVDAHVREVFDMLLQQLIHHDHWRVLVDQRRMESASVETQYWFQHVWVPRVASVLKRGYAAIIVGQDVFTHLATISVMRDSQLLIANYPSLGYRLFPGEADAITWLGVQER